MVSNEKQIFLFTGSYTKRNEYGLRVFTFHTETGEMNLLHEVAEKNASFLDINEKTGYLYCTAEMPEKSGQGAVAAYRIDPSDGSLTFVNRQPAAGGRPTYVRLDGSGRFVLAANYGSGNVNLYPLDDQQKLLPMSDLHHHSGSGPNRERQDGPHPHCIMQDAHNRYVFVPDLGIDQVVVYKLDLVNQKLIPHDSVSAPAGSGPRHIVFHPNGSFAYVVNELDATVSVFRYQADEGKLTALQHEPSLPDDFKGENTAAEIRISPDGHYLYMSNRGADNITVFQVDPEQGTIERVGSVDCGGRTPRNFNLSPDGRFLVCGNQDSDNVVVFRIDPQNGIPEQTGLVYDVPEAVCIRFYDTSSLQNG
jgi:6-phosphogluconolactonase